jgi:predicted Fe-S protein YdhL (DUF1289 family)
MTSGFCKSCARVGDFLIYFSDFENSRQKVVLRAAKKKTRQIKANHEGEQSQRMFVKVALRPSENIQRTRSIY